ncbi:hypothetical protein N0V94_003079 [Neodidymelliopsis sp. IMI 364377]|nr:hypothetical protein N0V94_003079 [Neodidymelliopsis sp. IMI 364377]
MFPLTSVGPREISILDKAALPLIYGPKTECEKATWYSQVSYNPDDVNIGSIRDPTKHRQRRRAWDRGLSTKALLTYEPRIKAKVDMLIERLKAQAGRPIDATAWSMFFSFDVMGDLSFGQDFGNLATGKEHPGIRSMHSYLWLFGVLSPVPWLMNLLMALPGAARALIDLDSVCLDVLERKEKSWDSTQEPTDVVSWFLKAIQENDISACPTRNSLFEDTKGVVIAGRYHSPLLPTPNAPFNYNSHSSDTTANALTNILFYLSRHPSIQQKLHHNLHTAMPGGYAAFSYAAVRKLSYLDDIINETLRLKPPVIQGQPRETPPHGLQVGSVWIPGRVNVAVPTLSIQRDARWWPQAESFIPERWGERREEMRTDGAPWNVFQSGVHACAGKALAYVTLRIVVAALVMGFEVRVAEGESEERLRAFEGRFLSSLLMGLRPLGVVFRER